MIVITFYNEDNYLESKKAFFDSYIAARNWKILMRKFDKTVSFKELNARVE